VEGQAPEHVRKQVLYDLAEGQKKAMRRQSEMATRIYHAASRAAFPRHGVSTAAQQRLATLRAAGCPVGIKCSGGGTPRQAVSAPAFYASGGRRAARGAHRSAVARMWKPAWQRRCVVKVPQDARRERAPFIPHVAAPRVAALQPCPAPLYRASPARPQPEGYTVAFLHNIRKNV